MTKEEAAQKYVDQHTWNNVYEKNNVLASFMDGAEWQKKQIMDKACEWLENYFKGIAGGSVYIEDFKKAMEE